MFIPILSLPGYCSPLMKTTAPPSFFSKFFTLRIVNGPPVLLVLVGLREGRN